MIQNQQTGELEPVTDAALAKELEADGHCVVHLGEVIPVKGGKFRVDSIGRKSMVIKGLPKTHVEELDLVKTARDAEVAAMDFKTRLQGSYNILIALIRRNGGALTIPDAELQEIQGYKLQSKFDEQNKLLELRVEAPALAVVPKEEAPAVEPAPAN